MGQVDCKACLGADPSSDTIKFGPDSNATLLANAAATKESEQIKLDNERVRLVCLERLEQEAAENRRIEQEAAEHRRIELQQEEERRKIEEERRIAEEKCLLEAKREAEAVEESIRADQEVKAAEEAERKALQQAQRKTDAFLNSRGFKGVNVPRKKMFKTSYALHAAVEENGLAAVEVLLKCGADKAVKNSAGKTPLELAQKLNKGKSHDAVISALS